MKKVVLIIATVLLVSGVIYAGYQYFQAKQTAGGWQSGGTEKQNGIVKGKDNGTQQNGGMVAGEITAMDAKNFTIKLPEGGSKIVFFSDSTKISAYANATVADLVAGEQATVIGTKGDNGEITAQSVQIGAAQEIGLRGFGREDGSKDEPAARNTDRDNSGTGGMDFSSGQIAAITGNAITIKVSDGSEKNIILAEATKYSRVSDSSVGDLAEGKIVMVTGSSNADGSVTAQSVQIRPEMPAVPNQNRLRNAPQNNSSPENGSSGGFDGRMPDRGGGVPMPPGL